MKVLIDEDLYPDLYAKLSDARHSRARAEMLRRWASMYLKLESGEQVPAERRYPAQGHAKTPASRTNHTAPTSGEVLQNAIPPAPSHAGPGGLSLPTNASNALVAGMGKYLS